MTSYTGQADGMTKSLNNNSAIISHQNQSRLSRQKAHGLVQLLIQNI